jgi:hypothetical protein
MPQARSGSVYGGWIVCTPGETRCQAKIISGLGERSHEPGAVCIRAISAARTASAARSMTCGRLYFCNALLERLSQHFEHVALARGQLIQEQNAVMRQRDLPRHGPLAAADQPHIPHGLVYSPRPPWSRQRRASWMISSLLTNARLTYGLLCPWLMVRKSIKLCTRAVVAWLHFPHRGHASTATGSAPSPQAARRAATWHASRRPRSRDRCRYCPQRPMPVEFP